MKWTKSPPYKNGLYWIVYYKKYVEIGRLFSCLNDDGKWVYKVEVPGDDKIYEVSDIHYWGDKIEYPKYP